MKGTRLGFVGAVALAGACGGSKPRPVESPPDAPDAAQPDAIPEPEDACSSAEPASGVIEGSFGDREAFSNTTLPAQGPAVGLYTATMQVETIAPKFEQSFGDARRKPIGSANEAKKTAQLQWLSAPGQSYDLRMMQWSLAAESDYPLKWGINWDWTPLESCEAPGFTPDEAKRLALDTASSQPMIGGRRPDPNWKEWADYFVVTVEQAGTLKVEIEDVSAEVRGVSISILTSQDVAIAAKSVDLAGEVIATVEPGEFLIKVAPKLGPKRNWRRSKGMATDPPLAFAKQKYTLEATLE